MVNYFIYVVIIELLNKVTDAYKSVGGLGSCRLFIIPFVAPAQRLSNFNLNDEESTKENAKINYKKYKREVN